MPRVALHAASTPLGVRPPPPSFAPFPDPVHVRGTRSAGPHGTTPAPSPVYPQWGARPPFAPFPYARKGGAGQETQTPPPPPPLTRERGAAQEVTRHPRLHITGTRQPPPPFVHARTGHANAGQAPAAAAAAPICAQGGVGHRNEVHGTEAARRPPRFARRGHAHEGSVRGDENGTAPHTLCAPPPFARTGRARTQARAPGWSAPPGSRARAMCEPERTEAAPSPRHRGKRAGRARWSQTRTGARTAVPPPLPQFARQGKTRTGGRVEAPPSLSRVFARQGKTRAGDHAEAPPLLRVRAQGQNASGRPRGSPPSPAGSRTRAKRNRVAEAPPPLWAARVRVLPLCAKRKSPASPAHEWEGEDNERGHAEWGAWPPFLHPLST
ncbi:hypothetical protein EDB89DRAFT_1908769 [Lactarius sanguifluus]|nr:hypothetical protein EDB89DRAFT_1908769 [Lactarius sanguifluus]